MYLVVEKIRGIRRDRPVQISRFPAFAFQSQGFEKLFEGLGFCGFVYTFVGPFAVSSCSRGVRVTVLVIGDTGEYLQKSCLKIKHRAKFELNSLFVASVPLQFFARTLLPSSL